MPTEYKPSPSCSITIRAEIENRVGMFARTATAIGSAGGDRGEVDIVRVSRSAVSSVSEAVSAAARETGLAT